MARLLGLNRGESDSPREITRTNLTSESGESGWLIRFFDSAFFCEWIAVSYLYKHDHPGVRDYLCNRMYTLPLSGIESYLFQICYMMVHKPSPSLDKFVIDMCSKSLQMALKVHWFLLAELEDSDDNEGISRIQEKCQIAATLMGEWPPLIRPQAPSSPISKNQVLNKLLSSKQRLLSLTSSPPAQRSMSFAPSTTGSNSLQEEAGKQSPGQPDDNKIFKKFIPGPKVRDALLFRKSMEKDDEESEKEGFFKRLLRDSKEEEEDSDGFFKRMFRDSKNDSEEKAGTRSVELDEKEGFFRRLLRDSKDDDEELMSSSEGFFKRLFRDNKNDSEDKVGSKSAEEDEKDGFFRKFFKEKFDDKKDGNDKTNDEDKRNSKGEEEETSEFSLFRRLFRVHPEDSKAASAIENSNSDGVFGSSPGTENLFRKLFRDRDRSAEGSEDSKAASAIENGNSEGAFGSSPGTENFFRKLFRDKDRSVEESGDSKAASAIENGHAETAFESSPGTENFFRKLFRDRDRTVEDSELFGSKMQKEKRPGSPRQQNDKSHVKPPLPTDVLAQVRKGSYHASLDFVQSLCDTSYGLVDIFPIEDRKSALHESLVEINSLVAAAQNSGGVCFPMGRGMYRVVHIPEDEAVLLNSREKAPYLICVEVLKGETPSHSKGTSIIQKLSRAGIPLANGDAQLHKPPPWAYPLWSSQDIHRNGTDRMLRSTSQAIDQAMAHLWEAKVNFVHVNLSVERQLLTQSTNSVLSNSQSTLQGSLRSTSVSIQNAADNPNSSNSSASLLTTQHDHEVEWVRVVLTADPGVNMGDIEVQGPSRRNQHRRVPSTVAIEEVKVNKGLKLTHLQFADDVLFFLEDDIVQAAAAKGDAPLGLPLKGAGQDSSDTRSKVTSGVPVPTDALSGELWEVKKERIRKSSVYGKSLDWDLRSVIVKSGDDCRQEHLAVQLVSHFYDIFQEAGLPLWLRPYEVLATSSYTALIETIPDTASIHSIKSRFPSITSLREFFVAKYQENSPSFKLAQRNFAESMAGYSILCYLLQVKDRHNGNLLLDEEGHVIHIDFGFILSNSPGGVNFESAPFKLTRELLEVMDSDAEGVPSEFFDYFKVLCIQGFLTCRKHAERIILLVDMMQDSGYPCFKGGPRTIQNLRKRFHLSLTEEQCVSVVLSLIISSLDAWRTRQYDYYQRVLNGIL